MSGKFLNTTEECFPILDSLQQNCPVIKNILLPNVNSLTKLQEFLTSNGRELHIPIIIHACQDGILGQYSSPFHHFCYENKLPNKQLTQRYLGELQENWFDGDAFNRKKQSDRFVSRFMELKFAEWLISNNYELLDLEAYGGEFDVSAKKIDTLFDFEVKYIPQSFDDFGLAYSAWKSPKKSAVASMSVYATLDYLFLRIHNSSAQLQKSTNKKISVVITYDYAFRYKRYFEEKWIDWKKVTLSGSNGVCSDGDCLKVLNLFFKDKDEVELRNDNSTTGISTKKLIAEKRIQESLVDLDEILIFKTLNSGFNIDLAQRILLK